MSHRATSDQNVLSSQSWPVRNHIAVFVRCLHLLDLDLLEDWPAVTEQLFAAKTAQQNLQQRVKAVEWSLFHLFEIYDPQETKDKLRPFFPPTTQLQSLNLRAALYRCLTELKKNGILAKDVLLRKTMLDDCKGERFEEVIASLAMTTLKKAAHFPTNTMKEELASSRSSVMQLAYRVSLRNNLHARKEACSEGKRRSEHFATLQDNLQRGLEIEKAGHTKTDIVKQKEVHAVISKNWIGNGVWTDILLRGVPKRRMMDIDSVEPASVVTGESHKLLQDLEDRIQQHHARLSQWKIVAKDLASKQEQATATAKPESKLNKQAEASLRFRDHKSLNISEWNTDNITQRPIENSYQRLIAAMKQEFSGTATESRKLEYNHITSINASVASTAEHSPSLFLEDFDDRAVTRRSPAKLPSAGVPTTDAQETLSSAQHDGSERSDSPSPIRSSDGDSSWIPRQTGGTTTVAEGNFKPIEAFNAPRLDAKEDAVSPSRMWMSLADRTRASMSFTGRHSILNDPDSPTGQETAPPVEAALPELHPPSDDDRRSTLVERTRKSMSLFAGLAARPKKIRAEQRTSQIYPVNQFETPGRPPWQSDWKPDSGASTPREQLFEEEAEYASVFKSRPKLALSPTFSPERRSSDLHDDILEKEMEQMNLDSDVD